MSMFNFVLFNQKSAVHFMHSEGDNDFSGSIIRRNLFHAKKECKCIS